MDDELIEAQQRAYSVAGVDESVSATFLIRSPSGTSSIRSHFPHRHLRFP